MRPCERFLAKLGIPVSKKAQMCYNRLMMLRLFVSTIRWVQKVAPWLHFPHLDRWIVKVWKFLLDLLV